MASLNWMLHEIERAALNPDWLKSTSVDLPQWMTRSSSCMPKCMITREIVATLKEMYGADVSATLISKVTDAVIEQVVEWQSRPLDAI